MMTSVVLIGLIYFICEMYLVHAMGDDQFIGRLEKVLERFCKHLITLKPSKCKFGMSVAEYYGKQIDQSGLSMSKKKIQRVLDFPKLLLTTAPSCKYELKTPNFHHTKQRIGKKRLKKKVDLFYDSALISGIWSMMEMSFTRIFTEPFMELGILC
jgi:hypothetical protein